MEVALGKRFACDVLVWGYISPALLTNMAVGFRLMPMSCVALCASYQSRIVSAACVQGHASSSANGTASRVYCAYQQLEQVSSRC